MTYAMPPPTPAEAAMMARLAIISMAARLFYRVWI